MQKQDVPQMVKKALAAFRSGKKSEAHRILMQVVDLDDQNEQAWLYLSLVVDSLEDQQICLENVLAINPNNQQAKKALGVVKKKLGVSDSPPPPPSPTPASSDSSFAATGWDDDGGDSWGDVLGSTPSSPVNTPAQPKTPAPPPPPAPQSDSTGWFDDDDSSPWGADSDDPAISGGSTAVDDQVSTSVEWGGGASAPVAHGSGRQVEQPSGDQYDDWVTSLGISSQAETSAPEPASAFGDSAGEVFGSPAWESDSGGWGSTEDVFGDIPTEAEPAPLGQSSGKPDVTEMSPLFGNQTEDISKKSPLFADAPSPAATPVAEDDDTDDDFFNIDLFDDEDEDEDTPPGLTRADEYFSQIPEDILAPPEEQPEEETEVQTSGSLVTVFFLFILNIAAIVGLAFQAQA